MVALLERELVGVQEPSVMWVPPFVSSRGREAVELAAAAGLMLDLAQQLVLVKGMGVRADGKWAAREVAVCMPRQNGKGGILEGRELAGLFVLGEGLLIHSAHQFDTSLEAFLRMEALIEEAGLQSELRPRSGVSRSHGSEGFTLKDGRRLRYRTRTKGGGRGFTCDCLILDEAMFLAEASHGALLPTLSAQSVEGNPQVWYTGSAVDQTVHDEGVVFARVRERGRRGGAPSLAWFEWSAGDGDLAAGDVDLDLDDREAWARANSALGLRISEEYVGEVERRSMDDRTFTVERLGIGDWPATFGLSGPIDIDAWSALADLRSELLDPVCFAFDVTPDRAWAAISAAGARRDGLAHMELVEQARGTGWVKERLVELVEKHAPVAVLCDAKSPAFALVPELEEVLGMEIVPLSAGEYAQACGKLVDLVAQSAVRHLAQPELTSAIKGASTRPLGDAWAWSRKSSAVNISPLVAGTLALWGASTIKPKRKPKPGFAFV